MIVRNRTGALGLMLAWKGSVVPHFLPHIFLTALFAAGAPERHLQPIELQLQ